MVWIGFFGFGQVFGLSVHLGGFEWIGFGWVGLFSLSGFGFENILHSLGLFLDMVWLGLFGIGWVGFRVGKNPGWLILPGQNNFHWVLLGFCWAK